MEKNKIKFYNLEIEVELNNLDSPNFKENIKKLTNEYKNCFIPSKKDELIKKIVDYQEENNFKENVILTFFPTAEGQDLIFNGKVIDKSLINSIKEYISYEYHQGKIEVKDNKVEYNIDGIGIFKGEAHKVLDGEYPFKTISSNVIEQETSITSLKVVLASRKKIANDIIYNLKEKETLFTPEQEICLKQKFINPISEVQFSGINKLRLALSSAENGYKDPRWVTFNQANSQGWSIKKGEKGTLCEKLILYKEENGKKVLLDNPFLAYFTVFNAEQIKGIPPLEKEEQNEATTVIKDLLNNSKIKLEKTNLDQVFYDPIKDHIIIPPAEKFNSKEDYLKTVLHELSHSTGNKTRLNRHILNKDKDFEYQISKEELIVELSTLFAEGQLKIDIKGQHFNDNHFFYEKWVEILEKDFNDLFRFCQEAEKSSKYIKENYTKPEVNINLKDLNELEVCFHSSNIDFGITPETTLTGKNAFQFLKELEERKEGNLKISLKMGEFSYKNLSLDLKTELNKYNNIIDNLEYRLNSYVDFIENKFILKDSSNEVKRYFKEELSKEEIYDKITKTREKITIFYKNLKEIEKNLDKTNSKKKNRIRETRSRIRSKVNER
ncbi:MAG: zincin-like metallopeptidase domain-containing protein [Fusobacterium mortiferum]|nr:zincin-like metallopeptidase domain-containing protein [Fusobacterium mortiferum]